MIVEVSDAGDFVPGFLGDRVVEDDVPILRPTCFAVFLEFFEAFVVELLFVPVIQNRGEYLRLQPQDESDNKSVIGIIRVRYRLRHDPTSTFKAE